MKTKLALFVFCITTMATAQVGINTTTPNAQLEIKSSNEATPTNTDGILIPKVNAFPVTNPTAAQQGMMVYLTTTVGANQPGFYYWDNTVTLWKPVAGTGGTLDNAYDFGGAGLGKTITADAGAVLINGTDGFVSTGTFGSGVIAPSGAGTKMFWNPRKAAFRAGSTGFNNWDDVNIGVYSTAFGQFTSASGFNSLAFGQNSRASGDVSTAFGRNTLATGRLATAFGYNSNAVGYMSTAFGSNARAQGDYSITSGLYNTSGSVGEITLGLGATTYSPSLNGDTEFRAANATDRLLVVGNAIDLNNDDFVDISERSDALIILKNGLTRLPSTTNAMITAADGKAVVTKEWVQANGGGGTLDNAYDYGGAGLGKTITADAGAVLINGIDGLVSTGTLGSGVLAPTGAGIKMFWNPRKAAFRAGEATGTEWDNANIGLNSIAFGKSTVASGTKSTAFGDFTTASGLLATAFGETTDASGDSSTAFGSNTIASGFAATSFGLDTTANGSSAIAFGNNTTANGLDATSFGTNTTANGVSATAFGKNNIALSYGETTLGIGSTTYTQSLNGATQYRTANATDRLLVVGNAIDANNNGDVDVAERSDALMILKNGLTRLPSTTNTMINAADGKAVVTKEWVQANSNGTLDDAYDFGGAGLGKTITADAGAVLINGTDGFVSTGTIGSGSLAPTGTGPKMFWNPRKGAFRAGRIFGTEWDDANIGFYSWAFGRNTTASGSYSSAFGTDTTATSICSTAFGFDTTASGDISTAFGYDTLASGVGTTAFGMQNTASSYGETTLGIGATTYTPSLNGATQLRTANATDRLLVVGNAIDVNNNNTVDPAERSDALVILKNGNTGIGTSTPSRLVHLALGASGATPFVNAGLVLESNGDFYQHFLTPNTSATTGSGLLFGTNAGSIRGGMVFTAQSEKIDFRTGGNTTRMTITNAGDVGIGTAIPGGQLELSLNEGRKPGSTTWTIVSDKRLKTINGNYTNGLNEIIQLNPVRYNYKNTGERKFEQEILDTEFTGFIAQEVQPLFPDAVKTDADGYLSFNMHSILVASINAFKELDEKNKSLDEKTKKLEQENETLQTKLNSQTEKLNAIILRLETLERKN